MHCQNWISDIDFVSDTLDRLRQTTQNMVTAVLGNLQQLRQEQAEENIDDVQVKVAMGTLTLTFSVGYAIWLIKGCLIGRRCVFDSRLVAVLRSDFYRGDGARVAEQQEAFHG